MNTDLVDNQTLDALREIETELLPSDDATALAAASEIEAELLPSDATALAAAAPAGCAQYTKIRGAIQKLLPFVEKIPKYGRPVAAALRLLMGIADAVCHR